MTTVNSRRVALVAALFGLLAALGTATVVAPDDVARPLTQAAAAVAASDGSASVSPPSTGVTRDVVRHARPTAARTALGNDRAPVSHVLGWAVAATLLLLAAFAFAVGVRRLSWRTARTAWRGATAPRAPPALACR